MNSIQKLLNCDKHIFNSAKKHRGNPNILLDTLCSDINFYSPSDFVSIIKKFTLNDDFYIDSHHIYSQNKNIFITKIIKRRNWVVKIINPSIKYANMRNVIYRKPLYMNVIKATQRCYSAIHKLQKWYGLVPNKSINKNYIKYLNKLSRFIKHGFVREALDALFCGTYLNVQKHQLCITTKLAYIAEQSVSKNPFKVNGYDKESMCCNIDDMLCGNTNIIKQMHLQHSDIQKIKTNERKLHLIKQRGLKYLVVTIDKYNPFACTLSKVTKSDGLKVIKAVKQNILAK